MSRFASKQQLLDDIVKERRALDALLDQIPAEVKGEEVTDGMSVKDFLAHRTEWGRMLIRWYDEAKAGGHPAVPSEHYKWNQLKELNAEILERYRDTPLEQVESDFVAVHDAVFDQVSSMSEDELLHRGVYAFTGSTDLAAYVNSATAAHYRSARKHIARWWRARR